MKRVKLERYLASHGCFLVREGARHSVYFNPRSQSSASVPRHREISDITAQEICKQLDLPKIWKGK
ncbi:addiction module toxin, HicA family [Candidatus Kaiserbacteria bacterium RIFCSPLOWO2_01_FULL_59_34]|nr:MAG: addiction module toxin, HicA family [Candidatus Kaiserbacteria bacterium RIFCSPLOWO2_01_FULL_59_34]OGG86838.1 MAG: addiction module toxin, HicA family [Candidatus Kaiserbacteria bacterium RIFCSPLOWO2_02_FULL_59_19]